MNIRENPLKDTDKIERLPDEDLPLPTRNEEWRLFPSLRKFTAAVTPTDTNCGDATLAFVVFMILLQSIVIAFIMVSVYFILGDIHQSVKDVTAGCVSTPLCRIQE